MISTQGWLLMHFSFLTFTQIFKAATLSLFLLIPFQYAHSLVDYTEPEARSSGERNSTGSSNVIRNERPAQSSGALGGAFRLASQFDSQKVETDQGQEKVDFIKFHGQFLTNYDVFLDVRYWMSPSEALEQLGPQDEQTSMHQGNARATLGFNWINFGAGPNGGSIDLYAGGEFKASESSSFGHSRNDLIVGAMTTKRFYAFALGLGYELTMTGNPSKESDMALGAIQKLYASLAWRVSPDIQMVLEGNNFKIGQSDLSDRDYYLSESQSFSSITPSLVLRMSPLVRMRLGATFQTNKVDSSNDMVRAKLWNIDGLYGNRLFVGLNFSI